MQIEELWSRRIQTANTAYKEWESLFKCKILEKYYEGFQYRDLDQEEHPYVVNFFYSTINEKISAHLYARPQFKISPKPGFSDYDLSFAVQSAQLKEDTLNTIISNDGVNFEEEIELAYIDSFFRFGVIEVGYSADWIINPNAGKPLLRSFKKANISKEEDRILKQPDFLPENEQVYFKRIDPERFRVGGIDSCYLNRCDWVGYYDLVYKSDLYAMKGLKNLDQLDTTGSYIATGSSDNYANIDNAVKIWHIWSIREGKRLLLLDAPMVELWSSTFYRLPLFAFRGDRRTKGFYPIPPAFQWISPQDEINDARQQLKNHRRRFIRKFQVVEGTVDDIERDKFENGPDGSLITVKKENAITAIETASLGPESDKSALIAKDDMNIVSGTGNEARGVADRMTATQSRYIEGHANRRESKEDAKVAKWICAIGREALLIARDKFTNGTWVKLNADPGEEFLGEVQDQNMAYRWVTSEDLSDGFDFRIDVDITSMSPDKFEEEKRHYVEFLSLLTQFPQIAISPTLVRETAYRCNYRNEKVIKEFQKIALIQMLGQANIAAEQSNQAQAIAQRQVEQMTPNTQAQIENQLQNQVLQ